MNRFLVFVLLMATTALGSQISGSSDRVHGLLRGQFEVLQKLNPSR